MAADYYSTLGVSKSASTDEIKRAYRKQALEWHPDKHASDKETAERKFKEINEAYQVLSNPQKKASYDQFGSASSGQGFGGQTSGRQGPFTYSYTTNGGQGMPFDFGDPFEIFNQFFGGGFGRQARVPRYSLTIDFMESAKGTAKTVEIEGKRRTIKIPAGVEEGSQINFKDFILSVSVRPHEVFQRDGSDVYINVDIAYSLATFGGSINVPALDGKVKIKIRAGTQPGTMMRLKGMGIPHLGGRGKGDEYVRLNIEVPSKLSRGQKRIIEEMRKEGL